MIRVLINDGLESVVIDVLKDLGVEVVNEYIEKDVLGEKLKDFNVIVIRLVIKFIVDVFDVEVGGNLELVIRVGVGIDNIDIFIV